MEQVRVLRIRQRKTRTRKDSPDPLHGNLAFPQDY